MNITLSTLTSVEVLAAIGSITLLYLLIGLFMAARFVKRDIASERERWSGNRELTFRVYVAQEQMGLCGFCIFFLIVAIAWPLTREMID